jgi:hypothetical protein
MGRSDATFRDFADHFKHLLEVSCGLTTLFAWLTGGPLLSQAEQMTGNRIWGSARCFSLLFLLLALCLFSSTRQGRASSTDSWDKFYEIPDLLHDHLPPGVESQEPFLSLRCSPGETHLEGPHLSGLQAWGSHMSQLHAGCCRSVPGRFLFLSQCESENGRCQGDFIRGSEWNCPLPDQFYKWSSL